MVDANEVLEYIQQAGPVLPKHIADAFGISTLFASAFLSEISSKQYVHTSHLKIGGSPLYYTDEHRERLVDYRGNLHEKEQKTFEYLRSERVLDDKQLELLDRVALRKMEDFAVPLAVDVGGERRIFWKYYLTDDAEATRLITELISEQRTREPSHDEVQEAPHDEEASVEAHQSDAVETPTNAMRSPVSETMNEPETPAATHAPAADGSAREAPPVVQHADPGTHPAETEPSETSEPIAPTQEARPHVERQSTIGMNKPEPVAVKHAPHASEALEGDKLGDHVIGYFSERGISVLFAEVGRKNKESFGVCRVPSAVGDVEYYFYAKEKKSITDKDVKEAFAESSILGYPLLYLAKGDVHKKASELVGSKIKGCVIVEI